ncbi:tyrosine-protein kinase [Photobacterium kishitanii]|uniref:polysaccharide biosynthesis tyrosine autokinase n=1 Tax=Photobacterium kishitanii TaxID=318456 RepID=UPI000D16A74A|nr:polysaccharide biosynthesis tyrosine autokinase [Photobacterium kishitanii]PSW62334.1 tyrosine-protein kinase [Photobacterium kishitanii]
MSVIKDVTLTSVKKNNDIDLSKIIGVVLEYRWSMILIIAIATIFGFSKVYLSTSIYKADALIQVEPKSGALSDMLGIGDEILVEPLANAEVGLITSRMILGKTVDQLDLTTVVTPQYQPIIGYMLAKLSGKVPQLSISRFDSSSKEPLLLEIENSSQKTFKVFNSQGQYVIDGKIGKLIKSDSFELIINQISGEEGQRFTIDKQTRSNAISQLKNNLSISEQGLGTGMLVLTLEGKNPILIEAMLNDISNNYLLQNVERKSEEVEKGLNFATEQISGIKEKLSKAEDKLNNYRLINSSVDLNIEANSTLNSLIEIESKLSELKFQEIELSKRFTKDHPSYISLLDNRKYLEQQKINFDDEIKKLPQTQQDILRLTRDVNVNQQIYIQLLNKAQELRLIKAGTVGNVRIIDVADVEMTPISPNKKVIVNLSFFVGIILGLAQAFFRAAFNRGILNPSEMEFIGLPVYASIPASNWQNELVKKEKRKKELMVKDTLLAVSNTADLSIEALRSLRTSLYFVMMEAKNNVLMVSGPTPGIGKSFIAANMATVIAQTGQRVLVIDADMRKGRMERQLCVEYKSGLSDYLSGQLDINAIIKHPNVPNLDYIGRGDIPPNPSELLLHPRFKVLIDWASANYDMVIIDTPPILAVTDAAIVGSHVGTTLIVARFSKTSVKELEAAKQRFEQNGIEVKGFILNAVERKSMSYYREYSCSTENK